MNGLAPNIEYLLTGHDCVVVPGLGAFLIHETPAHFDNNGYLVPPSRTLGFNPAVNMNDGLLVESVARRRELTIDMAQSEVENEVKSFRHQLTTVGSLPVGSLGVMTITDGNLCFEPSDNSIVNSRYNGLHILPVKHIVAECESEPETIEHESVRDSNVSILLKIAASVIILMVACGIFFTTNNLIDSSQTNFASLDSGFRQSSELTTAEPQLPVSREIELNIAKPTEKVASLSVESIGNIPSESTPGRYLLVVGSFPSMKQSLRFIGSDERMSVIEMDGKFRIYISSASTLREANELADSFRDEFPSVWICKR